MIDTKQYTLIENQEGLDTFIQDNQGIDWMGFDTEFIGEKRFYTLLCLIQIATERGNYLLDAIKIKDLRPFFDLIENPTILKITHAGENDYRILNQQWGIIPKNTFDTQIAAGFVGYRYPLSFGKLLDKEINRRISKGYMVTDWQARPLKAKQISYALNDVIYLRQLYDSLKTKLDASNRYAWVIEEMQIWEGPVYYEDNIHREAIESRLIQQLQLKEQVFLIRLFEWRLEQAKAKNYSKEMILPKKLMGVIVKNIGQGKSALKDNRIISNRIIERHWNTFNALYQERISEAERTLIEQIPAKMELSPSEELSAELLYLIMKKRCMDSDIATELLISKNNLKQLRLHADFENHPLCNGWRRAFLGEGLVQWLTQDGELKMSIENGRCVIEKQ